MPRKTMSREDWRAFLAKAEADVNHWDGDQLMVNVSGGAASAYAWWKCIQLFGADRVHPVFADTRSEDPDTYRFLDDCERVFAQKIVRLQGPGDIWDCFHQHGIMRIATAGNACKASVQLKQKPLDSEFARSEADAQAFGLTYDEPERMLKLSERLAQRTSAEVILFPLVAKPKLSACQILLELEKMGITPPSIYQKGFIHNNCLGAGGCILAGLSQWAAIYKKFPERFAYAEKREREFHHRTGFTVLRDQSGKTVKPYTLTQLREDVDAGRDFGNDWVSPCKCFALMLFPVDELL